MKMFVKILSVPVALLCAASLSAADTAVVDVAKKYPFSEIDKALFYNPLTQKMESPFSTASVESFSENQFVTIETDSYTDLLTSALKRGGSIQEAAKLGEQCCDNVEQVAKERYRRIGMAAGSNVEKFKALQSIKVDTSEVQLSHRDLVHLLQWAVKSITTEWITFSYHLEDFYVRINLHGINFKAPKKLKEFITQDLVQNHQQEINHKWLI